MKNKSKYISAALAAFVFAVSLAGCEKGNTGTSEPEVTNVQTSSEVTTAAETTAETTALTTTVSETVTTTEQTTVTTEVTTEEVTTQATEAETKAEETEAETEEQVQTESYSDRAHKAILGSWTVRSYVNLSYIGFTFYEDGTWEAIPVPMPLNTDPEYGSDAPTGTWNGTNGGRDYYAYAMYDENGELYHQIQVYTDDMGYETLEREDGMCYYNGKEHKIEE
ncbi:hypothetical protein [Ruminococcus sp. HUN007]|uniref:hypothetical protein n=1 Tax=Ruminococcus sp. HUN007 TaxID=1514668 RepID=UPI0005D2A1FC|nr:hypothetical protein [Ruminococcus sp. HUN007]